MESCSTGSLVSGFFHGMFSRFIQVGECVVLISWYVFSGNRAMWEGLGSGCGVEVAGWSGLSKADSSQMMVHKWAVADATDCRSASILAYRVIVSSPFSFILPSFPPTGQHSKLFWSIKTAPVDPFPVLHFGTGFFEVLSWENTQEGWIFQVVM